MTMGHAQFWNKETLCHIMIAAMIMHNIIMEEQRDEEDDGGHDYDQDRGEVLREVEYNSIMHLSELLKIHREIEDKQAHEMFREDLVEHVWSICSSK
jgi:hypothetical protein